MDVTLVIRELEQYPDIRDNHDREYIIDECRRFLKQEIAQKTLYFNLLAARNGIKVLNLVRSVLHNRFPRSPSRLRANLTLDAALLLAGLGESTPDELDTHTIVPEPLIEMIRHPAQDTTGPDASLSLVHRNATLIMPPWHFPSKLHGQLIEEGTKLGDVYEFRWQKKAISADVETTARSYHRMIDYYRESLMKVFDEQMRNGGGPIRILAGSAGVPVVTGALKRIFDGNHNHAVFDHVSDVALVGMADLFADCYRYGARTKPIGEVAEKRYDIYVLRKAFAHMAPIDGIPALERIKGNVTWITSYSDIHFPLRNQKNVIAELKRRHSKIKVINIRGIGHIGISLVYYVLGGGFADSKHLSSIIRKIITKKIKAKEEAIIGKVEDTIEGFHTVDIPDHLVDQADALMKK